MTKRIQQQNTMTGDDAREEKSAHVDAILARFEDAPESDSSESDDLDDLWLTTSVKEKERTRLQRQNKARRELERHLDEKRLKELVDDWYFDDKP